jgi:membrane protease YdiL (CAAX protease family)
LVKSIGARTETWLVVVAAFGLFVVGSASYLFRRNGGAAIFDGGILFTIGYEVIALAAIAGFLKVRGWTIADFGLLPISLYLTMIGAGLFVSVYVCYAAVVMLIINVDPNLIAPAGHSSFVSPHLSLPIILLGSTINPLFEESILCGYLISVRRTGHDVWPAIHLSILIRLLCHLYQGILGVISIILAGFIYACWYVKSERLWPPIVAHALFDLIGLLAHVEY